MKKLTVFTVIIAAFFIVYYFAIFLPKTRIIKTQARPQTVKMHTQAKVIAGLPGEDPETQKKYAEMAKEFFNNQGFALSQSANYKYHYNKQLGKCFILITTTVFIGDNDEIKIIHQTLSDLLTHKEYGNYAASFDQKIHCVIDDKMRTQADWDNLIKQYMEE